MEEGKSLHCPVCKAGFRSTRICSRCGADLTHLMILSVRAQLCREKAREAIYASDFQKANISITEAQKLHETEKGRQLKLLIEWLNVREGRI